MHMLWMLMLIIILQSLLAAIFTTTFLWYLAMSVSRWLNNFLLRFQYECFIILWLLQGSVGLTQLTRLSCIMFVYLQDVAVLGVDIVV